jgi:hypothetical protein
VSKRHPGRHRRRDTRKTQRPAQPPATLQWTDSPIAQFWAEPPSIRAAWDELRGDDSPPPIRRRLDT